MPTTGHTLLKTKACVVPPRCCFSPRLGLLHNVCQLHPNSWILNRNVLVKDSLKDHSALVESELSPWLSCQLWQSPQSRAWRREGGLSLGWKSPNTSCCTKQNSWQDLTAGGVREQSRDLHFPHLSIKSYHSPMFHNHCATTKMEGKNHYI